MKVTLYLICTIGGTLAVLFGTLGVGQLAPGAPPLLVLLSGMGLLVLVGAPTWWGFRRSLTGPGALPVDLSELSWTAEALALIARKFSIVGRVLGIALALSVVGFSLSTAQAPIGAALESMSFYAQGVFLAAVFAAVITTFPLGTALRAATGASLARHQQISRVVLRGKDLPLEQDEQLGAARMAAVTPVVLPLLNFSFGYLYASLGTQYVRLLMQGQGDVFTFIVVILLVATVLVFVPLLARQVIRAHRYASEHAALLVG